MNDMSETIVAKSDQINAADLIGSPRTITIKEVRIKAGDDQPVSIFFEGDKKAFRPCKGVRRLMVRVWGADANQYIGKSMTLFHDPTVTWAGKEEGGIRVSHMSDLKDKIVEFMRVSRAGTKPYEVLPLRVTAPKQDGAKKWSADFVRRVSSAPDSEQLEEFIDDVSERLDKLKSAAPELHAECIHALDVKRREFGDVGEGPDDSQRGEGFVDDGFGGGDDDGFGG